MLCYLLLHSEMYQSWMYSNHSLLDFLLFGTPQSIKQFLCYTACSSAVYFIHSVNSVYVNPNLPTPPPQPFPWYPYMFVLYPCVSTCFANKVISTHFSRFHMYVLIYIFLLSWFHSVWQSLGPSRSLQMTHFCSSLWLRNQDGTF